MITVDELLAAEITYIQEHKDDPIMYFNEEYHEFMPYMDGTNLDFLKKGYIKKHHQSIDKFSVDENLAFEKYGITDIEKLILLKSGDNMDSIILVVRVTIVEVDSPRIVIIVLGGRLFAGNLLMPGGVAPHRLINALRLSETVCPPEKINQMKRMVAN